MSDFLKKMSTKWLSGLKDLQGTLSNWGLCPQFALSLGDFIFKSPRKDKIACEKPLEALLATPLRRHSLKKKNGHFVLRRLFQMGLVKKDQKLREARRLKKASRSPFSQPGSINKMGERRAAILGRPKIDRVFLKPVRGSHFWSFFATPLVLVAKTTEDTKVSSAL